jgi:hypothetical protein
VDTKTGPALALSVQVYAENTDVEIDRSNRQETRCNILPPCPRRLTALVFSSMRAVGK